MIAAARRISFVSPIGWLRGLLIAALSLAGAVHLLLAPDHFGESALMGVGFLCSALAQFGLALAVLVKPRRFTYVAVIGVSAALIAFYAYNVMIGLPFSGASREGNPLSGAGHSDGHHSIAAEHEAEHDAEAHSEGGHHSGGLALGEGEAVEMLGATTKLSELAAIGLAVAVILRSRVSTRTCVERRVEEGCASPLNRDS
jgi:hypothetical protein